MEDTVRTDALEVAGMLSDHRGEDVVVIHVGEVSSWTDFFVICTVRSATHLRGLLRALEELFRARQIEPLNGGKHLRQEEGWVLIDCGAFVVHLMDSERREFYELEKLWFKGKTIYSSKSS